MKSIIAVLLLIGLPFASAAETLLTCEGTTTQYYGNQPFQEKNPNSLSMIVRDNEVELSTVGVVELANKSGITYVWTKIVNGRHWLYNLDTISGELVRFEHEDRDKMSNVSRASHFQCKKVEKKLLD